MFGYDGRLADESGSISRAGALIHAADLTVDGRRAKASITKYTKYREGLDFGVSFV
jgi:hypothetical protein